jgi:hypothetical protein
MIKLITTDVRQVIFKPAYSRAPQPQLLANLDLASTIYYSDDPTVGAFSDQLPPLGVVIVDGLRDFWAATLAGTAKLQVTPHATYWSPSPAQIAEQIASVKLQVTVNGLNIIIPSGDTSGVTDTAAITNALATSQTVTLADGSYYVLANAITLAPGQSLIHNGDKAACYIYQVGGAAGFTICAINSTATFQPDISCTFRGIFLRGDLAASGATGWKLGDINNMYLDDIAARNFTGYNFRFVNTYYWTEQLHGTIYSDNGTDAFDVDTSGIGSPSGSFERMDLLHYVSRQPNQDGIAFLNGAYTLDHGNYCQLGNYASSASPMTSATVRITGQTPASAIRSSFSSVSKGGFNVGVEVDTAHFNTPSTIIFGSNASNFINRCKGVLDWSANGAFSSATRLAGLQFDFDGDVFGDDTLLADVSQTQWTVISTGFPNGVTGSVSFLCVPKTGIVMVKVNLELPSAGSLVAGTVLVVGLSPRFTPQSNEPFSVISLSAGNYQVWPFEITTAGTLVIQEATGVVAANTFFTQSHTYANSI